MYALACDEFLRGIGLEYTDEVRPEDISNFHHALKKRGPAEQTMGNRRRSVMSFLRYCNVDMKVLSSREIDRVSVVVHEHYIGPVFAARYKPVIR